MMDIKPLFKALADESRIRILAAIGRKGLSVAEIAAAVALTPATVSHHLGKLREAGLVEAERESYYTIYRFCRQPLLDALRVLAENPEGAAEPAMLDRYDQQVLSNYLANGKLTTIPAQRKKREVILRFLAQLFEPGRKYSEKEVNLLIADYHDDFATLRRELIMARLLTRSDGIYWRSEEPI
jgi:ArsR family transcriptional regulator